MIEIIQELDAASNLLQAALDRYRSACATLRGCCSQWNLTGQLPRELSHRITDELLLADSYEKKIKESKTAISVSRNCCADIVPINTLPDEILSWIFCLVLDSGPCASFGPDYLNDIDISSHVCSRWRHLLISLGPLWSHIDLDPSSEQFFARAVVYAARAGRTPLDVHITDGSARWDTQPIDTSIHMIPYLTSIAPRIGSLSWEIYKPNEFYAPILRACLANCIPGNLTRLVLENAKGYQFMEAAEDRQTPGSQLLDLPKQHLEDLWLHITVLRVNKLYPPWTSKAYYGLTTLYLLSDLRFEVFIPERQLIAILRSSPQLCVFHFDLTVTDRLPIDAPIAPIHLECLEVLVWKSRHSNQLGTFLRLIAPGSESLQLSIGRIDQVDSLALNEMKRFFARSKVAKLLLRSWDAQLGPMSTDLLDILPPLEVLALGHFDIPRSARKDRTDKLDPHTARHSCFQALYLMGCQTHLDELQRIIKRHSVQRLTVQRSIISSNTHPSSTSLGIGKEDINEQLRGVCPVTKFVDWEYPVEIEGWYELN